MLIAIAGSIGAGKSTVARAVSSRLGIAVHAIDDDKLAVGAEHPDFERWVAEGIPFPDGFRERVFARTLRHLADLAVDHPHVIVEETFHRKVIRESFLRDAAEVLGGFLLIEIKVDRPVALEHLAQRAQSGDGHMAGRAMFDAFQAIADPIEDADLTVENNGDLAAAVAEVCTFVERLL